MTLITTVSRAPRRRAPFVIGAVAAAALVFGGAGVAFAATDSAATDSAATTSDSSSSTERPAHEPHLHGTVVSADGSTITITDRDGFTRTIQVSSDTVFEDDLTADLAAGTEIRAAGTVNSNGTSLDATTIGTAPTKLADGGPGKGGPRGDHDGTEATTPSTDAPTTDSENS